MRTLQEQRVFKPALRAPCQKVLHLWEDASVPSPGIGQPEDMINVSHSHAPHAFAALNLPKQC